MPVPARGIFLRHVLRELAAQTLIVAAVLLAVLVIYQFSFVLGRAADGQIAGSSVPQLVLLSLRNNISVILPFAVLLGTVIGLGRLHYDSEVAAAQAAGMGAGVLYAAAAGVVVPGTLLAGWVAFVDAPAAAREAAALRLAALRTAVTRDLAAGGFRSLGSGATLYFASRDVDGTLREVFLQRDLPRSEGGTAMQVVLADHARFALAAAGDVIDVELLDGQSYEGTPGRLDWRLTRFQRQRLQVPVPQATLPGRPRLDALDTRALLGARDAPRVGELHWRLGWLIAVPLLGFLAVPLARLAPRQGRHARVPLAVLLFALLAGLLTSGRTWLERGETPLELRLWWVHALVLACALLLLEFPRVLARLRWRAAR